MKFRHPTGGLLAALALLVVPLSVGADEVVLTNGDRLSGTVVSMAEGTLTFALDLGGRIPLPWTSVSTLTTDEPLAVELADGTRLVGTAEPAPAGVLSVQGDPLLDPVQVNLADVQAINLPPEPERSVVRTSGTVDLGGSLTRGNTETDSYRGGAAMEARTRSNRYTVGGEFNRAEEGGEKTVDRTSGFARYDHFFSDRWFLSTNVTLTNDEFRDLTLRTIAGAGAGYQIFEQDDRKLSTDVGVSFVDENFGTGPDRSAASGRWAVAYEESLFGSAVSLTHDQELLVGLESVDDFLLRIRSGLRFPILAGITGSTQLGYDFDNTPSPGSEKGDFTLSFSVGYQWDTGR